MRKKYLCAGIIAMSVMALIGCAKTEREVVDAQPETTITEGEVVDTQPETTIAENGDSYKEAYRDVLDTYYTTITTGNFDEIAGEGWIGVREATIGRDAQETLNCIGYVIKDFSGDGIPELLIADLSFNDYICAAYTLVDGKPLFSFEGWPRSRYYLTEDGKFVYEGSGGAAYSAFGLFALSKDGTELKAEDFYFTQPKDSSSEISGYYHNTVGEWDIAVSEEITAPAEDFSVIWAGYEDKITEIDFTPLALNDF